LAPWGTLGFRAACHIVCRSPRSRRTSSRRNENLRHHLLECHRRVAPSATASMSRCRNDRRPIIKVIGLFASVCLSFFWFPSRRRSFGRPRTRGHRPRMNKTQYLLYELKQASSQEQMLSFPHFIQKRKADEYPAAKRQYELEIDEHPLKAGQSPITSQWRDGHANIFVA